MRYNISRIFGTIIALPAAVIAWFASIFALDIYFIFDVLVAAATFIVFYFPTQRLTSRKYLREIGLSRRDYHFVNGQLNNAQDKIRRIFKTW